MRLAATVTAVSALTNLGRSLVFSSCSLAMRSTRAPYSSECFGQSFNLLSADRISASSLMAISLLGNLSNSSLLDWVVSLQTMFQPRNLQSRQRDNQEDHHHRSYAANADEQNAQPTHFLPSLP